MNIFLLNLPTFTIYFKLKLLLSLQYLLATTTPVTGGLH